MKKENSRNLPLRTFLRQGADSGEIITPKNTLLRRVVRAVEATFQNLERYPYLAAGDREEFQRYREYFMESLGMISAKIDSGLLVPVNHKRFPGPAAFPDGKIDVGMFIGSFDPFQMTHLATALRFLASPETTSNILAVIPEGAVNMSKPALSDYGYRLELLHRQLGHIFEPFIVPLDFGRGRSTIGIVDEFIRAHPGTEMTITHVLGSDVLIWVHRLFVEDLRIWGKTAQEAGVRFSYKLYVIRRGAEESSAQIAESLRANGIPIFIDQKTIEAPSSTDFRDRHALTIIFPTDDILRHMEFAFRYRMNRDWPGWRDLD